MYELCYGSIKPRHEKESKECSKVSVSFIILIETDYIYAHIAKDFAATFHTSHYE